MSAFPEEMIPKQPPKLNEMTFGRQRVVIHEVNVLQEVYGRKLYMIAYHITDLERKDPEGRPLQTPVAHVFVSEAVLTEEERRGKTLADLARIWQEKFTEAVKEELERAVRVYRANVQVFLR